MPTDIPDIARPRVIGRHIYGHLSQTGDLNCVCGWTGHPTRNPDAAYATWEAHATAPDEHELPHLNEEGACRCDCPRCTIPPDDCVCSDCTSDICDHRVRDRAATKEMRT